jgi:hypothetical protein
VKKFYSLIITLALGSSALAATNYVYQCEDAETGKALNETRISSNTICTGIPKDMQIADAASASKASQKAKVDQNTQALQANPADTIEATDTAEAVETALAPTLEFIPEMSPLTDSSVYSIPVGDVRATSALQALEIQDRLKTIEVFVDRGTMTGGTGDFNVGAARKK